MIERCPSCRGRKTILKLGCFEGDCPACLGVGHIKKKIEEKQVVNDIETKVEFETKSEPLQPVDAIKKQSSTGRRGRIVKQSKEAINAKSEESRAGTS